MSAALSLVLWIPRRPGHARCPFGRRWQWWGRGRLLQHFLKFGIHGRSTAVGRDLGQPMAAAEFVFFRMLAGQVGRHVALGAIGDLDDRIADLRQSAALPELDSALLPWLWPPFPAQAPLGTPWLFARAPATARLPAAGLDLPHRLRSERPLCRSPDASEPLRKSARSGASVQTRSCRTVSPMTH